MIEALFEHDKKSIHQDLSDGSDDYLYAILKGEGFTQYNRLSDEDLLNEMREYKLLGQSHPLDVSEQLRLLRDSDAIPNADEPIDPKSGMDIEPYHLLDMAIDIIDKPFWKDPSKCIQWASGHFLTETLPPDYHTWSEDRLEEFIQHNVWEPFEHNSSAWIMEHIESMAHSLSLAGYNDNRS